jgi:hypothetical protein
VNWSARIAFWARIGVPATVLAVSLTALVFVATRGATDSGAAPVAEQADVRLDTTASSVSRRVRDRLTVDLQLAGPRASAGRELGVRVWWKPRPGGRRWTEMIDDVRVVRVGSKTTVSVPEWSMRAGSATVCVARSSLDVDAACAPAVAAGALPADTAGDGISWMRVNVPKPTSALDAHAMWIHQLERSSGGNVGRIAARAHASGVQTVIIKASGGPTAWDQFTEQLVDALHAQGLQVCAYQRLFGERPKTEAKLGIAAVEMGADCLVLDAESEYKNQHAEARVYLRTLRAGIGEDFPVGFTSFPYVSYHTTVPWKVFLGPGGAQYNLPQIYWKTIGDPVDHAVARTWRENVGFGRPIVPIGQTYLNPAPAEIRRFRQQVEARGARGVSWWVWQLTDRTRWEAITP